MDDLEKKLNSILADPAMMGQLMQLAQSLGNQAGEKAAQQDPSPQAASDTAAPALDPGMLRKLSGLAGNSRIDPNQQTLLRALRPYISSQRIARLERAMRAAKMAGLATAFLGSGR